MEEKKEEGKCGGCGIHCNCCICKVVKAVVLLLIGGIIGYGIAHCGHKGACPMSSAPAAMTQTAPTPAPAPVPKKAK